MNKIFEKTQKKFSSLHKVAVVIIKAGLISSIFILIISGVLMLFNQGENLSYYNYLIEYLIKSSLAIFAQGFIGGILMDRMFKQKG